MHHHFDPFFSHAAYGLNNHLNHFLYFVKQGGPIIIVDQFPVQLNTRRTTNFENIFDLAMINDHLQSKLGKVIFTVRNLPTYLQLTSKNMYVDQSNRSYKLISRFPLHYITQHQLTLKNQLRFHADLVLSDVKVREFIHFIQWNPFFYQMLPVVNDECIHVVHLRLEYDGLQHWSNLNHMRIADFEKVLRDLYISLMKKIYEAHGGIFIILADTIPHQMVSHHFPFFHFKTNEKNKIIQQEFGTTGRELRAVFDLALVEKYGNHSLILSKGSTFSDFIRFRLHHRFKKLYSIDLNNIKLGILDS